MSLSPVCVMTKFAKCYIIQLDLSFISVICNRVKYDIFVSYISILYLKINLNITPYITSWWNHLHDICCVFGWDAFYFVPHINIAEYWKLKLLIYYCSRDWSIFPCTPKGLWVLSSTAWADSQAGDRADKTSSALSRPYFFANNFPMWQGYSLSLRARTSSIIEVPLDQISAKWTIL